MLFKLSSLFSNFALTLGYLTPALNNPALKYIDLQLLQTIIAKPEKSTQYGNKLQSVVTASFKACKRTCNGCME